MTAAWDPLKAAANYRKHGIRFSDAETALHDPFGTTIAQEDVDGETRMVVIGADHLGRILTVVHVHRGDTVRLISARHATRSERSEYEEGI
ncbi:MAG: BrnT family toxin [bacterium]|nr:BrnT family toxin [bacterium]